MVDTARVRRQRWGRQTADLEAAPGHLWVRSDFNLANGYGDTSRSFVGELVKRVPLLIQALPHYHDQLQRLGWGDKIRSVESRAGSCLSIQPTFSTMLPPTGTPSAMFTMCEVDRLLPEWRSRMNEFDLVIVPNNENEMQYRGLIETPIACVPLGIDFEHYRWEEFHRQPVFRFGTAGNLGHGETRKGLSRVIRWFKDAFPWSVTDVRLSVKTNRFNKDLDTGGDSRIEVVSDDLPVSELAAWHHSLDVYADASTYEGWGMFPCHSLACGRPVIGVYYGGHREYFKRGNHLPIGYRVQLADHIYEQTGGAWAMPIHSEGVEAMRYAYANQAEMRAMGRRAAESVRHLTWKRAAINLLKALRRHGIYDYQGEIANQAAVCSSVTSSR